MKKAELTQIANEMLNNGVSCTKKTAPKGVDYDAFKNLYVSIQDTRNEKIRAKIEAGNIRKAAAKYKVGVRALTSVIQEIKKADISGYSTGHSMGWDGVIYVCGVQAKYHENKSTYAKSCTWKPTYGSWSLNLTAEQVKQLAGMQYQLIGGLVTFVEVTKSKIKKAFVLEGKGNKQTYRVSLVPCFVTGTFHGETVEECEAWRLTQATRLIENRSRETASRIDLQKRKARFVGLQHSMKVGNCERGTIQFAQKHGLDPEAGYQVGYLLELEDSQFTRRLLNAK